jgi:hypothetical protein
LFGRAKVAVTQHVFENKNLQDGRNQSLWNEVATGAGASITHDVNSSAVILTVGTASGEVTRRRTRKYFSYVAGNVQRISLTAVLVDENEPNRSQTFGYMDNKNGAYFEYVGGEWFVCRRSYASGSLETERVAFADGNMLVANGQKYIANDFTDLSPSKIQLGVIEILWQGAGGALMSVEIDGTQRFIHHFKGSNVLGVPFIGSPNLPVTYEIENTGVCSTSASMKEVCSAIVNEGEYLPSGIKFGVAHTSNVSVTTRRPIIAIRLANSFNSEENRRIGKLINTTIRATTNDALIEIVHAHGTSSVTGTFGAIDVDSALEVSYDISAITADRLHVVEAFFAISGQGSFSGVSERTIGLLDRHSEISQNETSDSSEYFVVFATGIGGTSTLMATLAAQEY